MQQLTTLDAGFLEAEDSDRHVSLAIDGMAVIEGPIPDYDSVFSGLARPNSRYPPVYASAACAPIRSRVDELARKRDAHIHRAYIERHGPRV